MPLVAFGRHEEDAGVGRDHEGVGGVRHPPVAKETKERNHFAVIMMSFTLAPLETHTITLHTRNTHLYISQLFKILRLASCVLRHTSWFVV